MAKKPQKSGFLGFHWVTLINPKNGHFWPFLAIFGDFPDFPGRAEIPVRGGKFPPAREICTFFFRGFRNPTDPIFRVFGPSGTWSIWPFSAEIRIQNHYKFLQKKLIDF